MAYKPRPSSQPRRRRVQVMYGSGGGGHKATAAAVEAVLRDMTTIPTTPPIVELLDAAAMSGAAAGDWLYNVLLSYNAVSTIEFMHTTVNTFYPLVLPALRHIFRQHWAKYPDLSCVVSLVPMLNDAMAESLPPSIPLLTVLTDFSHTKSHPWIQHPRQHLIIGTDIGYAQALALGYLPPHIPGPSQVVTKSSGMVVHPRFYQRVSRQERERKREEMGLHPSLPTVLILFGGTPIMDHVIELVDRFTARQPHSPVNLIAVCARNRQLYDRLQKRKRRNPRQHLCITGFTKEVPLLMQLSDLLIGKPGPGVVSEAVVSRLPCVLLTGKSESHVMKQEKDVLDWVRMEGIGMVVRTPADAAKISYAEIAAMKERLSVRSQNRAVFQVGELILQACGYEFVRTEEADSSDENVSPESIPDEADIGAMDVVGGETDSIITPEGSASPLGQRRERASVIQDGAESDAELLSRRNGLSPTTIKALPSKPGEGEK